MLWVILILISVLITMITFFTCGSGGMMLLLLLNGFSESQATPVLIVYALFALVMDTAISSALSWSIIKKRYPDSGVKFWVVVGVNFIIPILLLGVIFAAGAMKNLAP